VLDNFSYGDTPTDTALAGLVRELLGSGETFSVARQRLSRGHDIRPLVVATVLTYLELNGTLRATGPFYSGYRVRFVESRAAVIGAFDPARQQFLNAVFDAAKQGRIWLTLDPDAIAEQLGQPRDRIVSMVGYLEQRGAIETKPSGLRHGYVREREVNAGALTAELVAQFDTRERKDLERTARVLAFAEHGSCLSAELVGYFGQTIEPCGHCGPCLGEPHGTLPAPELPALGDREHALIAAVVAEGHSQLAHPRALTRFLCGLRSPATQGKGGLQRDKRFGALESFPFQAVLQAVRRA
jgi:ATP-dependent DNA helicase RecQ